MLAALLPYRYSRQYYPYENHRHHGGWRFQADLRSQLENRGGYDPGLGAYFPGLRRAGVFDVQVVYRNILINISDKGDHIP